MTAGLSPAGWTLVVVGVFVALLALVLLRIATRDRSIRGVRVGVFYERERDSDD